LVSPSLAAAALPGAVVINMQGMVLLIGIASGPAAVAVFATLRTISRAVTQLISSVLAVMVPELSRAIGMKDHESVRMIHRRGCQIAFWFGLLMVAVLALFGSHIVHLWTSGRVAASGLLLYLFLITAVIDSLWLTSLSVLYAANRHQRVAVYYLAASLINLPFAYLLLQAWGLDGAALSLMLVDMFMLLPVLSQSLPAAHDRLGSWIRSVLRPPISAETLAWLRARGAYRVG
jgi:O-antigen/teichoic acid export membrane protein